LKALEKEDIAKGKVLESITIEEEVEEVAALTPIEEIIVATDVNTLSPMQALMLLNDMKEKLTAEKR
jgi:hypothetical protein